MATKKNNNKNNEYVNKFTGENMNTYPIMADLLGTKVSRKTGNQDKLHKQIEKFHSKYRCPFCGEERQWISSTNIMVCKNKACKGYEIKSKDGEAKYVPSFRLLSHRGESIAETLLD